MLSLTAAIALAVAVADRPPLTGEREPGDLVVASFNIRYGTAGDGEDHWALRRPRCIAATVALDADVLGVQEALTFQVAELREALPEHTIVGVGRDDGNARGEHCPIVVRDAVFAILEHGTFWLSDTPDVPGSRSDGNAITRIVTWALLRHQDSGRTVRILNTHLDHRSAESRLRAAERIRDRIASWTPSDATIVMGDINAPPDSPPLRTLLKPLEVRADDGSTRSVAFRDTWRVAHPDQPEPEGTFHAFRGRSTGPRIDYILVCEAFEVRSAAIDRRPVDERWPSDHFPIAARLRPSWVTPQVTHGPPARAPIAPSPSASPD